MLEPKPYYPDDTEKALNAIDRDQASMGRSLALEPWKGISMASGWRRYSAGIGDAPEYTKDRFGFVHLRGIIESTANISAGATAFTLPVGYRPALHH